MRGDANDCSFIRTYSGKYFWPLEPSSEDVHIEDIAHALANQCRWTGHVKTFYSVAQHSVLVSQQVSRENALWGLLHDASEAYLVDLARPVKHAPGLGEIYREVEKKLEYVIFKRFGLYGEIPQEVKDIDNAMLWTEKRDLMNGDWDERLAGEKKLLPITIEPFSPALAEIMFLQRFKDLSGEEIKWSISKR